MKNIRNQEIGETMNVKTNVNESIQNRRLIWLGHSKTDIAMKFWEPMKKRTAKGNISGWITAKRGLKKDASSTCPEFHVGCRLDRDLFTLPTYTENTYIEYENRFCATYTNMWMVQRRLAWPPRNNDTLNPQVLLFFHRWYPNKAVSMVWTCLGIEGFQKKNQ